MISLFKGVDIIYNGKRTFMTIGRLVDGLKDGSLVITEWSDNLIVLEDAA